MAQNEKLNIFLLIKSIYTKKTLNIEEVESYHNIAILKWLSYDSSNLATLEEISKYFFYLSPELYLKLIYLSIDKKEQVPFLHKITKETKKENELYNKIRDTLRWTDRELRLYSRLLDKIIEPKYWKQQLGV